MGIGFAKMKMPNMELQLLRVEF
jgi:hypothetical protein